MTHKINLYEVVTNKIIEQLEKGVIPWHKPWTGGNGTINYVTRRPYSFLNSMLLGKDGEYLTFKQIKDLGGSVKKGAKSHMVVFFTMIEKEKKDSEEETKVFPVLKYYRVFHLDDTTGIESKIKDGEKPENTLQPIEQADEVINAYVTREGIKFTNNELSSRAFYSPSFDEVVVPMLSQYRVAEEYYSTTFHELTHSTMKKSRCNREGDNMNAHFGSKAYSREELVAEMGAAMLCNVVGIECDKAFKNSVAYIQSWLKALKNDNKMIVWASSRAEKASKYIIGAEQ